MTAFDVSSDEGPLTATPAVVLTNVLVSPTIPPAGAGPSVTNGMYIYNPTMKDDESCQHMSIWSFLNLFFADIPNSAHPANIIGKFHFTAPHNSIKYYACIVV